MDLANPRKKTASLAQSKRMPPSSENSPLTNNRKEAMQGFLEWIKRNGGIEKYLTETGIISSSQIQQLRKNLTVAVPAVGESVE